ncbi:beta-propeller domain-containing protein [Patescibacteria group bacterium]|nr:beta-propeller domain-containing protein [Patescibacteria group bacterium]
MQESIDTPSPETTVDGFDEKPKRVSQRRVLLIASAFTILILGLTFSYFFANQKLLPDVLDLPKKQVTKIERFESEEDFKTYLAEAETAVGSSLFSGFGMVRTDTANLQMLEAEIASPVAGGGGGPERVSETNVQIAGIDEPDIVKTDGTSIYFSKRANWTIPVVRTLPVGEQILPPTTNAETKVLLAFPPASLSQIATIPKQGDLLLDKKTLIIFSESQILGYDVVNPASPTERWKVDIETKNQVVTSRLFQNKLYIITKSRINNERPCPIPLLTGKNSLSISCGEIYHPNRPVPTDSTFTILSIDPTNGEIQEKTAFVGSANSSVVYMSENAIYITYSYSEDMSEFLYNFYVEAGTDLISETALGKLKKLQTYDISASTKLMEIGVILENYYNSLSSDEKRRVENEMTNRMESYTKEHSRDLQKTGIVKIAVDDLSISANGEIPGNPLNQFSLDEYKGDLRIATTTGSSMWGGGDSFNDVYVLNSDLEITGSIQDLGLTERIYSARFIEDKGYLVTFRRIDPFYVLDLSNSKNPEMKGELKIPGYSSYLHPITEDRILGIGEENNKVKISLFNVSSVENPTEASKYILDEYWSEVADTHHAFLLDSKHGVFFLPGRNGGYVFSYKGDELKLERVVSEIRARRAIYLDDYMYIIGDDKIVILNESDWMEVNNLTF